MRRFVLYLIPLFAVLGVWIAGDLLSVRCLDDERLALDIVDIQHPEQLLPKLDHLRRFDGVKIVILGDSLIYGKTMEAHGDAQWREHTLCAALRRKLGQVAPDKKILVLNLGINGALPGDLEALARLIVPLEVDMLIVDTHLRPFSGDFEAPDERFCRPWLDEVHIDGDGNLRLGGKGRSWLGRSGDAVGSFLTNHWDPYRKRHFLQERISASSAFAWGRCLGTRRQTNSTLDDQDKLDILLLKLKGRLDSVSFAEDRFQRSAMQGLLDYLSRQRQKTIVFYATEQPALLKQAISPETYIQKRSQLENMILSVPGIFYRGRVDSLTADDYLDFSHLNASGYEKLADALVHDMSELAPDLID